MEDQPNNETYQNESIKEIEATVAEIGNIGQNIAILGGGSGFSTVEGGWGDPPLKKNLDKSPQEIWNPSLSLKLKIWGGAQTAVRSKLFKVLPIVLPNFSNK